MEILTEGPEKIRDQQYKQNGPEPNSSSAAHAVSAMPVEATASAQYQNENDNDNQHLITFATVTAELRRLRRYKALT